MSEKRALTYYRLRRKLSLWTSYFLITGFFFIFLCLYANWINSPNTLLFGFTGVINFWKWDENRKRLKKIKP